MTRQITWFNASLKSQKKGKLGIFEPVENNGIVFAPRQCLHQKVAMGMENLKMQTLSPCNKRTGRYGPGNKLLHAWRKSPKMEIWESSNLSKTMVPSLHQANVYMKR